MDDDTPFEKAREAIEDAFRPLIAFLEKRNVLDPHFGWNVVGYNLAEYAPFPLTVWLVGWSPCCGLEAAIFHIKDSDFEEGNYEAGYYYNYDHWRRMSDGEAISATELYKKQMDLPHTGSFKEDTKPSKYLAEGELRKIKKGSNYG